ncbi:MAG: YidC/Oxa1 family rane protein insertase [Acidobacteriaceae bacterium]|nr:YidC/Oxa1 family rane protein insertase [Acidobacteriaceae bacterium]
MPEILNPNLQSPTPGGGNKHSALVAAALGFVILCTHLYFVDSNPGVSKQANQAQSEIKQPSDKTGQAISNRASVPGTTLKTKTTGHTTESPTGFGWLTVIARPLYLALRLVYKHGVGNWGWAIIVLTTIFNLLMLWPRMMSMKSSLGTMRLQPKVDAVKKRYANLKKNDPKRTAMNSELMALYKNEGTSLYAGCLPLLLQLPLFVAYFRVLQNAVELRQAHWFWLTDLSSPDPLHILPSFIIITMCLTQFITPSPGMDPTHRRLFAFVMPLVMGFTLWRYASGLALYWATGNLINLLVQLGINRTRTGKEMQFLSAKRMDTRVKDRDVVEGTS